MIERILNLLQKLEIEHYRITQEDTSSAELFFVKKRLDMRRSKQTGKFVVEVHRDVEADGKKLRGSSEAILSADMDDEEAEEVLKEAMNSALYALNPYYELYRGTKEEAKPLINKASGMELMDAALRFTEAMYRNDTDTHAFINSSEVFVQKKKVRILNSEGTDVGFETFKIEGNFITQCKEPADVEQRYIFEYNDLETEAIAEKVAQGLKTVADRAQAVESPKAGNYDLILSGENLAALLDLYTFRANSAYVYAGYSNYRPGYPVQGSEIAGEKLKMTLIPSNPYSPEGIPMTERLFVNEGNLELLQGGSRYAQYLGIEPTGSYDRVLLDNGTVPFDELKQGCLYPVSFSDFQMDPMSGYFAGEIRLAYLYEEGGVKILTGGSVNGSLLNRQADLAFSLERYKDANYEGPLAVKIKDVAVAG